MSLVCEISKTKIRKNQYNFNLNVKFIKFCICLVRLYNEKTLRFGEFVLFLNHVVPGVFLNGYGSEKSEQKGKGIKTLFTWKDGGIPKPYCQ